jgi:predicted nucleic acid-binding protein
VILRKRGVPVEAALSLLFSLEEIVQPIEFETYGLFEQAARTRLVKRGPDDWPVLATALALRSPIWTEDNDFFGTGVATWTTDRVELFLGAPGR